MDAVARVIIVGAGAAGLAAGEVLARAGMEVTILEARNRIGGRIWTIQPSGTEAPVDLGAEFVQGEKLITWDFIRKYGLETRTVPDRHWQNVNRVLVENRSFWGELSEVFERIDTRAPDTDFDSFLGTQTALDDHLRGLSLDFVEGFHGAPVNEISVHSVAKAESASEQENGTKMFRLATGYGPLMESLAKSFARHGGKTLLQTIVSRVSWELTPLQVSAKTASGQQTFSADRVLITLPIGVLRSGTVKFEPVLQEKEEAFARIGSGAALKVTLHFRSAIWPVENFGFVQSNDPIFPTWWSDDRGPILVAWAGGPRAEKLAANDERAISEAPIKAAARVLHLEEPQLRAQLAGSYVHEWLHDPFSRCAYSYTPVGGMDLLQKLAEPVGGVLFFAGEATNTNGDQGTVHGAITTGLRAADEILRSLAAPPNELVQEAPAHA